MTDEQLLEYLNEPEEKIDFLDDGCYIFIPKRMIVQAMKKFIEEKEKEL